MGLDIFINHPDIVMELHIQAVIVDDQLVYIRDNSLYLVHIQEQSVGGHENKRFRQLFPGILVEFHNSCIQPRFIISVQGQVAFVAPVPELVNNIVIQAFFHPGVRTLLRVLVGRAEFAGAVAAVDGLQVHHIGMRYRIT